MDTAEGHHGIRFYYAADGCTLMYRRIEYGNAFGDWPDDCGGGTYCGWSFSPTMTNNTTSGNSANCNGGGIWAISSIIIVFNSVLYSDSADTGEKRNI